MAQKLNENCRLCLLSYLDSQRDFYDHHDHQSTRRALRRLLISCGFLYLFLGPNKKFAESTLEVNDVHTIKRISKRDNEVKLAFDFSSSQVCLLIKLVSLECIALRYKFYHTHRRELAIQLKALQQFCNAIRENHRIKEIRLREFDRSTAGKMLLDQLPDRIVEISCPYQTTTLLLGRKCLIETMSVYNVGSGDSNFKARKIFLRSYTSNNLDVAVPFKRNDSIEVIEFDIFDLFHFAPPIWEFKFKQHYSRVFRNLRTINDKLKIRLETQFEVYNLRNEDELKQAYQEGLSTFRDLIDWAEDAGLSTTDVFIIFQDAEGVGRWNDVSELSNFFTSQGQELQNTKADDEWRMQFLTSYKNIKIVTQTTFF
ncbi:hypothetical protein M3Y95_00352300 [Aphelenchoides besseyi]|nr:hypothetical protein M3Y95_00352300 [Aphelenchoides besseyi]